MIMVASGGGGDYENLPVGRYKATCYRIIDMGTHKRSWQDQPEKDKRELRIYWEITSQLQVENDAETWGDIHMADGRPFSASKKYTASLHENATLHKDLKSWRGRSFTEAEVKGFELSNVLGVTCEIEIIEYGTEGKTAVDSLYKPDGGAKKVDTINEIEDFDVEIYCKEWTGESSEESKKMCDIFETLPPWLQEEITTSQEVEKAQGTKPPTPPPAPQQGGGLADLSSNDKNDDNIPF
jgi:hypothetical protein